MVVIAATAQFLTGGFYITGLSVYFLPITRDLGLTRAALSLAFTLRSLEGGLDAPLIGYLSDRFGPRFMVRAGGMLAGVGFIALAYTRDYVSFLAVFLLILAPGFAAGVALPLAAVVNHWFARQRAMAITLSHVGAEIGGALLTPLVAFVVFNAGWREASVVSGIVLLIVIPLLSWFIRETPESMGMHPDGEAPFARSLLAPSPPPSPASGDGADVTRAPLPSPGEAGRGPEGPRSGEGEFRPGEAWRTRTFWQLSIAVGTRLFSKHALTVHLVPVLVWKGFDEPAAVLFVGLFTFLQVPFRIVAGYIADRWSMSRVPALAALAGVGAVAVLLLGEDGWIGTGLLFACLFALGETGNSPAWASIGHYFGRGSYATIRGSVSFVQSFFSLPAPVIAGWLFDTTQSYQLALLPIGGAYLVAFALFWTLGRPVKREQLSS